MMFFCSLCRYGRSAGLSESYKFDWTIVIENGFCCYRASRGRLAFNWGIYDGHEETNGRKYSSFFNFSSISWGANVGYQFSWL